MQAGSDMQNNEIEVVYINEENKDNMQPMCEYLFDKFQQKNMKDISSEDYVDLFYRAFYFFKNSFSTKLSPKNNADLKGRAFGEMNISNYELLTVPKNINNYVDFQKGNSIPFCKLKVNCPSKSFDNDVTISIDTDNNLVFAKVVTTKFIHDIKNKNKILDSYCYSISNYCIPNGKELLRGKAEDIINSKQENLLKINNILDTENIEETIAQSVLHMGRLDIDLEHKNHYVDSNGKNVFGHNEQTLLDKYFGEIADPPHFHFVYKDYVLKLNEHDSYALAINVKGLTNYLIDLSFVNKNSNSDLLKYDFGMPFGEIKKSGLTMSKNETLECLTGIRNLFKTLSEDEKSKFKNLLISNLYFYAKENNYNDSSQVEKYRYCIQDIIELVLGEQENIDDEMKFDAIMVLSVATNAIGEVYKLSKTNKSLKTEISKIGNSFYNTVECCMSKIANAPKMEKDDKISLSSSEDNEIRR